MELKSCDSCKKESCSKRVDGAVCIIDKVSLEFVKSLDTRDPLVIAKTVGEIVAKEVVRYNRAIEDEENDEGIASEKYSEEGVLIEKKYKSSKVNKDISAIARNIMVGGKTINEMLNPTSNLGLPFVQNNTQINFGSVADVINQLPKDKQADFKNLIQQRLGKKEEESS